MFTLWHPTLHTCNMMCDAHTAKCNIIIPARMWPPLKFQYSADHFTYLILAPAGKPSRWTVTVDEWLTFPWTSWKTLHDLLPYSNLALKMQNTQAIHTASEIRHI